MVLTTSLSRTAGRHDAISFPRTLRSTIQISASAWCWSQNHNVDGFASHLRAIICATLKLILDKATPHFIRLPDRVQILFCIRKGDVVIQHWMKKSRTRMRVKFPCL